MQLIKWEPLSEVERLLDNFPSTPLMKSSWDMSIDLYEEKGNMIAKMNIPGIEPENLSISVQDNTLRVSGSREDEKEVKDKHYYSKEIRRGEFEKFIRLPKSIDYNHVDAEYKEGTLEVSMPIVEGQKEASIKVKVRK